MYSHLFTLMHDFSGMEETTILLSTAYLCIFFCLWSFTVLMYKNETKQLLYLSFTVLIYKNETKQLLYLVHQATTIVSE